MTENYWIGFDLGGTKMIAALLNERFEIIERIKEKTHAQEGVKAVLKRISATIDALLQESGIDRKLVRGIGMAIPGTIDRSAGVILKAPNLGFENTPIRAYIEERSGLRLVLENDVNAGTYGEFVRGAGRGFKELIGLFPGTGIGGGLILNGRLYRGATGNAGEIGHMIVKIDGPLCGCGQHGCLESLASRLSISKDAVALASSGNAPLTFQEAGTDIKNYKSKIFAKAWKQKEPAMVDLITRSARTLGIGMANCANILNPEAIILGGGLVEKLGKPYLREAADSMRAHGMRGMVEEVKVLSASLGDDAVFIGAAALAREELETV